MKTKVIKTWPFFFLLILLAGCGDYSQYYTVYGTAHSYGVTVWTSSDSDIDVYVNGERIGTVTESYSQAPECGAAGCVMYSTEDGGIKVTLRGESTDGRIKWQDRSFRLNRDCRKVQLITNEEGQPEILVN